MAELEAALEACKEESFDEVDSALRELQDVEASFAQMMQSDRDGEGVEKSTKPEGALDSQAEGKVADEGGSISEAKEGANGDKSISGLFAFSIVVSHDLELCASLVCRRSAFETESSAI